MTCNEFFEKHYDDHALSAWIDHMYWEDNFSAHKLFIGMIEEAKEKGITLSDMYDFDFQDFFWNVYRNTEKGLS